MPAPARAHPVQTPAEPRDTPMAAPAFSASVQDPARAPSGLTPPRKISKPGSGKSLGKISISQPPEAGEPREPEREQSALAIVYRPLSSLKPYARNARTHSPEQLAKLKRSLRTYGWTTAIAIAGDDILAGHARHQAASEMAHAHEPIRNNPDPLCAPTIDLSHLSPAERRAYILADNRLALDAGWDDHLLKLEVSDLSLSGFDLSLTGFAASEIADILKLDDADAAAPERALSAAEDDALDRAWQIAIAEWHALLAAAQSRAYVTTTYTKGVLAVQFLRALYLDEPIPSGATLAYTPHRVLTDGDKGSIVEALAAALAPDARSVRNSIRWASGEKPSLDKLSGAMTLPIHGRRLPGDFPSELARALIDEFCPAQGAVLDPCHGWGGRLLGFLLSTHAERYHGIDASEPTSAGVAAMYADLAKLTPERVKAATLICAPFESVALKPASFDFALTSPPYFDVEKYAGAASSWRTHDSYEAWRDGFYATLIAKVAKALKKHGVFALQVGSQRYPLAADAIMLAARVALVHEETRHSGMINNRAGTDRDDGEVVVLLRKR